MKKYLLFIIFFSLTKAFSATYLKVIYIADHTVNYNSKTCMLVRDSPTDTFTIFDKNIEGFTYQIGYEYCILIEVQTPGIWKPAIPFDSSQVKYILSEIKSKTKTGNAKTPINTRFFIPDSSKWILYKLKTKDGTRTFSFTKAFLQFNTSNNIAFGSTDCNGFTATYSNDSTFNFNNINSTLMACKRSIEKEFLLALKNTNHVKITAKLLYLYDDKKLMAIFTRKK